MGNRPTVRDVALSSGVSTATVSRVFAGKAGVVAPETREKVRNAAEALGYTPSEIGRSLRLARSRVVVLLVPDATNDFCADVAISLERSLSDVGLSMVLANTSEDASQQDRLLEEAETLRPHGIALLGAIDTPKLRSAVERFKNVVFVNRRPPAHVEAPYVGIDNEAAGFAVGRYFASRDYGRCAAIHGSLQYSASRGRLEGFLRGLAEAGSPVDNVLRIESSLTMEAGYLHGKALLGRNTPVRAVFCGNDMIAYGIHRAAEEKGVEVPDELAIFGFDDNRINEWLAPWLSTVKVPALDFGPAVASMLDPDKTDQKTAEDIVLPFSLTIRRSA